MDETDNRATNSSADLEPNSRHAPLGKNEVEAFNSPVCIHVHSIRKRLADPDGVSAKACIDGLVACGILSDDTTKQVKQVTFSQSKGKEEKTIIEIEAI